MLFENVELMKPAFFVIDFANRDRTDYPAILLGYKESTVIVELNVLHVLQVFVRAFEVKGHFKFGQDGRYHLDQLL